ncbi:MAG: transcriptional repressor NrdR [Ruminiclostridium sp.]|nr:transcriptional repressor NrdR [Ruminiclostridium sp.]
MRCPECSFEDSKVIDSRPTDGKIRRRRECLSCKCRFTTYEIVENIPLMVVKKDNSLEPFDSQKIIERVLRAAAKRPVSLAEIENMVFEIESEFKNTLQREVPSDKIGEAVLRKLRELDSVAYIRFASVYRDFSDTDSFIRIISEMDEDNK